MDIDPLELVEKDDAPLGAEERKSRLNNLVAISVAILATFMGLCKVKDDNIVQAMEQMQARSLDEWNFYQARNIREEVANSSVSMLNAEIEAAPVESRARTTAERDKFQKLATDYNSRKADNKKNAEEAQKQYDALNFHDDQFDLSDAMLAIAISLMALTSLTQKKWLFWLGLVPTAIGVLFGLAGLFGWHIHSDLAAKLLGT
jgi:hypothetical protein